MRNAARHEILRGRGSGARALHAGYEPESLEKNHAFQKGRWRTLGSGVAGERRSAGLGSLRAPPERAEPAERAECADAGRAGAAGRAVCSGMRDGRRRGVSPSPDSGMCSGSMSRMLLCDASRAGLRRRPSSCRTRARAPSSSMLFSSSCRRNTILVNKKQPNDLSLYRFNSRVQR